MVLEAEHAIIGEQGRERLLGSETREEVGLPMMERSFKCWLPCSSPPALDQAGLLGVLLYHMQACAFGQIISFCVLSHKALIIPKI